MIQCHFFTTIRKRRELHWKGVKKMLSFCFLFFYCSTTFSQVTTFTIDLSGAKDTTVTISSTRNGNICSGNNCIKFDITLNPGSDLLSLDVKRPAPPGNSAFYQVNCGPQTSLATPVCISGLTTVSVTFCKPGNDEPDYTISTSSLVKGSADLILRQNCSGVMSVTGLQTSSISWTSIFPGSAGQYNGYLSCTSNCASTTVTPQIGTVIPYIDYKVSGSTSCAGVRADTIRVYTTAALSIPISPLNPAICSNTPITLTANPSGGNPPYTYLWTGGQTSSSKTVTVAGTYTVSVSDNTSGCLPVSESVTVAALPTPVAPTASGTTICAGNTTAITATAPGGTYEWYDASSAGNLLFTGATYTTPVLNATTIYYVQTTVSGCTSTRTPVTVTVTPTPTVPSATGTTICAGNTAGLSATASGTINWYDAASGGSLLQTGASYTTPVLNTSTTYYVQNTVSGCSSARTAVVATVTPIPAAPTAASAAACTGTSVNLTATAPGGVYTWYDAASGGSQLHIGATYTTPVINANTSYYVETIVSGCTSTRTVVNVSINSTPPAPTIATVGICTGNTATLFVSSPLSGVTYEWYTDVSGGSFITTGTSYTTPVLNANITYYVQASLAGCSSSSRVPASVTVNAIPSAPVASPSTICSGNSASLTASAASGIIDWFGVASGGTSLQTGNSFNTAVLTTSTTYYVETAVSGCASARTPVNVTVNGIPAAPVVASAAICTGTSTVLTATAPGGVYDWYTVASGGSSIYTGVSFSTPVLNGPATYYVETTIAGCVSNRTTVTIATNSIPAVPSVSSAIICAGNAASLTVNSPVSGVTYQWYDAPSGGNLVTSGASFATPVLSDNTNYYVQANLLGCTSSRTTTAISVIQPPTAPVAASVFICTDNTATITATAPGGTYQWYDAATGGNLLVTAASYTTPVLTATTQYYVQTTIAGCTGLRSAVAVNVNPAPAAPTVLGNTICAGNSSSLTATAPGGSYQWFDAASGGTLLFTGSNYITPVLNNTTTYYVQSTVTGCSGPMKAVTVSVLPAPAAPTVAPASVCAGSAANLTATAPGGTYQWYDASSGGNLLHTGAIYTTPALNSTTVYHVQTTIGSCIGQRTAVTATVNPIPAAPVTTGGTSCAGNTVAVSASGGSGGSYEWYNASSGGSLLYTGAVYTTPALNTTTVYYVQSTLAGCTGSRTAATATVLPVLQPAFDYSSGTFCVTGGNPTPVIAGGNTGTFSATPAGLVFVSTSTGQINVSASALGTYTIQFVTAGPCVYSSSAKVTITNSPDASFVYGGPYCPQQLTALPTFSAGASAGVFSSGSAGLVFISSSTGEIDLQKTTAGTYTLTNNIAASSGCAAATASNPVTILPRPLVTAGATQTVCANTPVSLTGVISGTATKATWSGGSGSFADPSQLITQYHPAAGESIVKLYLTTDDPSGPCVAAVDSMVIYINPTPAAPSVQNTSVCTGNTATLIATAPGGLYEWFTDATGGTAIATGNTFVSGLLSTSTVYYVQSTINSCTGSRTSATVIVAPKPAITSSANGEVCSANPFTYLITSDKPGSNYTWARSVVTGISNPSSGGQTDSTLTEVLNNIGSNTVPVTYSIVPANKGCTGDPFFYTVLVKPTPASPGISNSTPICAGTPLNLFTSTIAGASYQWSGPNGFSSTLQNPVVTNVSTASAGIYQLVISVNNCSSSPSSKNIAPVIAAPDAASNSPLCEQGTLRLTASGLAGATYSWRGPAGFNSTTQNPLLSSVTVNQAGMYYVTASIAGCTGLTDSVAVNINIPPGTPVIASNSPVCSKDSISLKTFSISPNINFQWSGPAGFKSTNPSPMIPNADKTNEGAYNLTVSTPGCAITNASSLAVLVNQKPQINSISNNSPICEGDLLLLKASSLPGASFSWNSSSGYTSSQQNPSISNTTKANAETYHVVASLYGCISDTAVTTASIIKASVASAGSDYIVCANNASVTLSGNITGEDTQTGIWRTDGKGSFFPNANLLNAVYIPDATDTAKRKVALSLQTSNNKVCPVSTSSLAVNINPAPQVNAGINSFVCANNSLISLSGQVINATGGNWSATGSGSFQPSSSALTTVYKPSQNDIQKGNVNFYLLSTGNSNCKAVSDTVQYIIQPVPSVNAGNDLTIFENETVRLSPQVTGSNLSFLWTPPDNLSSATVQNPTLTGKSNQVYILHVTGTGSCTTQDDISVTVLKPFIIPNIFTPNGDGIHDVWSIPELNNYPGCSVEIFTRGGMKIFGSVGYANPWDGTFNGKPAPVATYYYIIRPNFRDMLFSGSVTVVR